MITEYELKSIMEKTIEYVQEKKLPYSFKPLEPHELKTLADWFNRAAYYAFPEKEVREVWLRHRAEIILGCMIAKDQFNVDFGGEEPEAGQFGITFTAAPYLGVGEDWDDMSTWTTGSEQNWIHSGTTYLGGTAGNPIKVGENALHVIIGYMSLHPSPKIWKIKFKINGSEQPAIDVSHVVRVGDIHLREFAKAKIWPKNTTILGTLFISPAFGSSVEDIPALIGVTFLPAEQLRLIDPADIKKSDHKIILTT